MSEAHEKTRIRQLEDAAAHWEHKYANARQYNRNLEERNQRLEAALLMIQGGHWRGDLNEYIAGVLTPSETDGECQEHDWRDARNEIVESGEVCVRCGAIRAGNTSKIGAKHEG